MNMTLQCIAESLVLSKERGNQRAYRLMGWILKFQVGRLSRPNPAANLVSVSREATMIVCLGTAMAVL